MIAVICAIRFDGGFDISSAAPVIWGIILYLALACTAAGYLLQNTALRSISAKTVALMQCACPVMTPLFSLLILSERMSVAGLIGAGILLLCVDEEILTGEDSEKQNR
ncbi:MAG: DMT family transporter [Oscillospiraceae bacterium]|nr:DMT family transporter [Oscillospiraceae bacterium]